MPTSDLTTVLAIPLEDVSAKVLREPPKDDAGDHALRVWAGVMPLDLRAGAPAADPKQPAGIRPRREIAAYSRRPTA